MSTVMGLFEKWTDAKATVAQLKAMGYDETAIGLLTGTEAIQEQLVADRKDMETERDQEDSLVPAGAVGGLAVGELAGLLTGAVLVAIPGVGQGLAAGAILAAGIGGGAVVGTIAGALVGMGADEEKAHIISADVEKGDVLVTLTTRPPAALRAAEVMRQANAANVEITSQVPDSLGSR